MALRYTIIDSTSGTPAFTIIDEPVGLDKITLHLGRDKTYHGFFDQVNDTIKSLQYYGSAYTILKAAYDNFGVDADVRLAIEFACIDTATYETLYIGRFNFTQYKEVTGAEGCRIEVGLENGNYLMQLKNRMDQQIALDSLKTHDDGYPELIPYDSLGKQLILPGKTIRLLNYARYAYVPQYFS